MTPEISKLVESHTHWYRHGSDYGTRCDIKFIDFHGEDFSCADLRKARFMGCEMVETNFSHSDLRGADFSYADLKGADFRNADLRQANFRGSTLRGALFDKAKTQGADFRGSFSDQPTNRLISRIYSYLAARFSIRT